MSDVRFQVIDEACDGYLVREEALINLRAFLISKVNDTISVKNEIF